MSEKIAEAADMASLPKGAQTSGVVVHLVPAMEQGGVETVVCGLSWALASAGWRSVVISRGGRLAERIRARGGEHIELDLKSKNPLTILSRAWRLGKAIRRIAPDVVCAHSRVPAWLFCVARRLDPVISAIPFVTYAHGANSVSGYSAVMTKGDAVIVPSRFLSRFLLENYGDDGRLAKGSRSGGRSLAEKISIVHPSVDFGRFDPAKVDRGRVAALRREWGAADGDSVVMAVGRITPLKGFDHLIRDLSGRLDVVPDAGWGDVLRSQCARLVIVGGADSRHLAYEAELKSLARSLGVDGRVVFAGPRDCVPECLASADMVVSGNIDKPESFGLSVAEAFAMNRPVRLLRHFGGAAEILDEVERLRGEAAASGIALSRRDAIMAMCSEPAMVRTTIGIYDSLRRAGGGSCALA